MEPRFVSNEKKANEVFYHVGDKKFTNEVEATRYEKRLNERQKTWDRSDFFAGLINNNVLSICVAREVDNQVVFFLDSKHSQKMMNIKIARKI